MIDRNYRRPVHAFGDTKRAVVIWYKLGIQYLKEIDNPDEMHILQSGCTDKQAKVGDPGTMTYTKGGPTGGQWKFVMDPDAPSVKAKIPYWRR